mmetsp:Transcript_178740/g.567160  ORF Transcript_178740/g.567160 Transcript_178740/m.567160 type:complete len:254 (-) Transcript_178740:632-1393(-)
MFVLEAALQEGEALLQCAGLPTWGCRVRSGLLQVATESLGVLQPKGLEFLLEVLPVLVRGLDMLDVIAKPSENIQRQRRADPSHEPMSVCPRALLSDTCLEKAQIERPMLCRYSLLGQLGEVLLGDVCTDQPRIELEVRLWDAVCDEKKNECPSCWERSVDRTEVAERLERLSDIKHHTSGMLLIVGLPEAIFEGLIVARICPLHLELTHFHALLLTAQQIAVVRHEGNGLHTAELEFAVVLDEVPVLGGDSN